jgi:arylsulfatase A-like enzyme
MKSRIWALLLVCLILTGAAFASAYNAQPKLVVIVIIDQFRPDYLERAHDQLGPSGFRLLTERGAYFSSCAYDYANTETAPGHATLYTGAYSNAHGIGANQWWDSAGKRMVSSVLDDATQLVGPGAGGPGASPHNLLSDTIGDELKIATDGRARVFAISLKDRSAILPGGFAANAAFWIDQKTGAFITSTFYMPQLPAWVQQFNSANTGKYWNREWKDERGKVLRSTTRQPASGQDEAGHAHPDTSSSFYEVVGATPFANDYELDFARELITHEKLGEGPATDLLAISLSAPDILGHKLGPNSPEIRAMVVALDRQLSEFFNFLGQRVGLANVWIALSADHGVSPVPSYAHKYRLPAETLNPDTLKSDLNAAVARRVRSHGDFIEGRDGSYVFISQAAFSAASVNNEADAERVVGETTLQLGMRAYFTRAQLAAGNVPNDAMGHIMLHSYSTYGGWYVIVIPPPNTFPWDSPTGTTHGSWYLYDRQVPLAFFGLPFEAGVHRGRCETVDMVATLASLLGINPPNRAAGRVLTEALRRENTR